MSEKLLQEILLRIRDIEIAIKDIDRAGKDPIHLTMERAYHEGIREGKRQAFEAMKKRD